jgi:uncharacterized protein YfaS (alpha-2-macroglobulin family)
MKILRFFIFGCAILLGSWVAAQTLFFKQPTHSPMNALLPPNYNADWKKVDSLLQKGLPKSALTIVNRIYARAKAENQSDQWVKAVMYRMRLVADTEEEAMVTNLKELEKEVAGASFPTRSILHSVLGEMYWTYYQQNRYRFLNRTTTQQVVTDDIRTWELPKIVEAVSRHYDLSLEAGERLRQTPIEGYAAMLVPGLSGRARRPTLYDFLAHRAIDFFTQSEASLTRPADQFRMAEEVYLAPAENFATYSIRSTDSLNFHYQTIRLLQEVLQFRLREKNVPALIDADLKRLAFVHRESVHPLKEEGYRKALENLGAKYAEQEVSAEIDYQLARRLYDASQQFRPLQSEAHRWEAKRAYDLCEKAIARFPKSPGAQDCRSLQADIRTKSLEMTLEKINLPDEDFRGLVAFKNVGKLYVRLVKTSPAEFATIHTKSESEYESRYQEKIIRFYAAKKPLHQFEISLPDAGDYQQHKAEFRIPGAPLGDYILLAGTDPSLSGKGQAVAYDFITVSSLSYLHRNLDNQEIEFVVTDRKTGVPLPGVRGQLFTEIYDRKTRQHVPQKAQVLTTDQQGAFRIPPTENYRNFTLEFTHQTDRLSTFDPYPSSRYGGEFHQSRPEEKDTSARVVSFFFTDRAIYRPGQPIHFKGIVLEKDHRKAHRILKNRYVSVMLYDVNRQEVARINSTSNEFGTFSGTFTAPATGLTGQMHLSDGYSSAFFSVEEYKRPQFEVEIPALTGSYRLGEEVTVKGRATAYSGASIDGAKVQYRVVRNADFPYWWFARKGYYPAQEITSGEMRTDAGGAFEVRFAALPDLSVPRESQPRFTYTLYADVTDQNGETHSAEKALTIGYTALKLGVDLPEVLEKTQSAEPAIRATNLNDEPVPSRVSIRIDRLKSPERTFRPRLWEPPDTFLMTKSEFYQSFPHDIYDQEDDYLHWEKEVKVLEGTYNTEQQKVLPLKDRTNWEPGKYAVEISATDAYGEEVKEVAYFTLVDRQAKEQPFTTVDQFQVLKGEGEPGESAELLAGTSATLRVLYELEKDDHMIARQWLTLTPGQKRLDIPLTEAYRGNLGVHYTFVYQNRLYVHSHTIVVPYTHKQLDLTFETFRNKLLPGEKEEWKIRIRGKKGEKVAAEMVATLYDASLDAFRPHRFHFDIYPTDYIGLHWESENGFSTSEATLYDNSWNRSVDGYLRQYDQLNWFGGNLNQLSSRAVLKYLPPKSTLMEDTTTLAEEEDSFAAAPAALEAPQKEMAKKEKAEDRPPVPKPSKSEPQPKVRTRFNETAFYYPHLQTDANGDVLIAFTVPEALTRWKMLGFAHTQELQYGLTTNTLVTQKDLMITANAPRFFRQGDTIAFTAKVANLSDKDLNGTAQLLLFDALTMQPIDGAFGHRPTARPFAVVKGQSIGLNWKLYIPEGVEAVTYRVTAQAGAHSDGEEKAVPVLSNRLLVTESLPLLIWGKQSKTFQLDKLVNQPSATRRNHQLTLEFTANPAWNAVQALPYLMEYPYECAEQIFSRYYANSLAAHVANANPKIRRVFESWKGADSKALLSNLDKNQELKTLLLEETPWVLGARDESERKRRLALLFDLNHMASETERALDKLALMQHDSGGWPWFKGMPVNGYITQHIVAGLGHLDHLGVRKVKQEEKVLRMTKAALVFTDEQLKNEYNRLKKIKGIKLSDNHLSYTACHYLYARSFFKDVPITKNAQEAFNYFKGQASTYWLKGSVYQQGMIALALHRWEEKKVPADIVRSLRERALGNEETGMYWKGESGYYWYQAPIETQALLIEVFDEVAKDDKAVDEMKVWLLRQKQTQDWKTTKATAEACYALLLKGSNWLESDAPVAITVGKQVIDPKAQAESKVEAGTGYFKTSWKGNDITPEMGTVVLQKKDEGLSWGALYWQYFEQLDKIRPHQTPLKLNKALFLQKNGPTGPVLTPIHEKTSLHPGDLIKVRIELRVEQTMEYVHLKDMRAAGLEPTNVLSTYRYQDGLGYYESTRDAATNFFFDYLPKGTYVFEYPLRVTHEGDFSNGITSIQSMYAPEFSSHSAGIRLKVKK